MLWWLKSHESKPTQFIKQDKRKMNIDVEAMVTELNELLSDAERVHDLAEEQVDSLTTIKDDLDTHNTDLAEAITALEKVAELAESVEGCINDAEEYNINP